MHENRETSGTSWSNPGRDRFFDNVPHEWGLKLIEHRVADRRILRLIHKWLKAGVSEDGQWSETKVGTPQGGLLTA